MARNTTRSARRVSTPGAADQSPPPVQDAVASATNDPTPDVPEQVAAPAVQDAQPDAPDQLRRPDGKPTLTEAGWIVPADYAPARKVE